MTATVPRMRLPRLCVLLLLCACREPSAPVKVAPAPAPPPAPRGPAPLPEKLGLRFLPVEEEDGGLQWLASSPIRCSAGEHDLVRCLTITPLASDPRLQPDGGIAALGVVAANAETAHRSARSASVAGSPPRRSARGSGRSTGCRRCWWCRPRTQPSASATSSSRVTETASCDNPVRPGDGCAVTLFPSEAAAEAMRAGELSCTARRVATPAASPSSAWARPARGTLALTVDAGVQPLPCLLRVRGPTAAGRGRALRLELQRLRVGQARGRPRGARRRVPLLVPPSAFGQAPVGREPRAHFAVRKPSALSNSAVSTAPPAAPRTVLCESATKRQSNTASGAAGRC